MRGERNMREEKESECMKKRKKRKETGQGS